MDDAVIKELGIQAGRIAALEARNIELENALRKVLTIIRDKRSVFGTSMYCIAE